MSASTPIPDDDANGALVARLLTRLRVERALIALVRGGLSTALRLEPAQGLWWVEVPSAGLTPAPGEGIGMSFRVDGVVARCEAIFEDVDRVDGGKAWRLRFPQRIDYHQQRESYRAMTLAQSRIVIHLSGAAGEYAGTLLDLSSTGFGGLFPAAARVGRGRFALRIDVDEPLRLAVEVLHRRAVVGDDAQCRVGGRFVDVTAAQQARIDRAAAQLQGRWLRARAR